MKSWGAVLLFSCLCALSARAADFYVMSTTGKVKIYQQNKALLIGVSAYQNEHWPKLPSIPGEIDALKRALIKQGFEAEDIEVVQDPRSSVLREKVRKFFHTPVESDARLFLFISGHGWSDGKESGYLLPIDALPSAHPSFLMNLLGMDEVSQWSEKSRAKHIMMVFDSCFSGAVFLSKGEANLPGALFINDAEQPVRQFITAGSRFEKVPARSDFADMLVRGLNGEADTLKDGVITGVELGYWLKAKITPLNKQTPQYGTSNHKLFQHGDVMFSVPGAPTVSPGTVGNRVFASSKEQASALTKSEVEGLRKAAAPEPLFDNVKLYYFQKSADGVRVTKALDNARIPYLKTRALLPDKFEVSAIACSADVPVAAVRKLATVLTEAGVPIRAIIPFRNPKLKPRRLELISLSTNAKGMEAITTAPLTPAQIANLKDCSWLQNRN